MTDPGDLLITEPDKIGANRAVRIIIYREALQTRFKLVVIGQIGVQNLFFGAPHEIPVLLPWDAEFADQHSQSPAKRSWNLRSGDHDCPDFQVIALPAEESRNVKFRISW